jgi:hypothetical protein
MLLEKTMDKKNRVIIPRGLAPDPLVIEKVDQFLDNFEPYEIKNGSKLILYFDKKSKAHYLVCHIEAQTLVPYCDFEASLNGNKEDAIYKLNRDITEDEAAYIEMQKDATLGRSFEDIVIEYDTSYNPKTPLKVYGGQHRIKAISTEKKQNKTIVHGIRVYFHLSRNQKVEIATVNNTSIVVPNDLLDRMREQLLGAQLRNWCQAIGLLEKGKDFSDRRSPEVPTVRIARTLLVNFYLGMSAKDDAFHQPVVCKSGGMDDAYMEIRDKIDWKDAKLMKMGEEFTRLHELQRERVSNRKENKNAEFARKALSLSIVASWSYAAGLFQRNKEHLKNHYALPDTVSMPDDPLNAKALSEARLQGIDKDTYRGLGARSSSNELGRMLEVFIVQATKATKKRITKDLANAAIQSYEAKRARYEADKSLKKI